MNEELKKVMEVAEVWTKEPFDAETRAQVKAMMEAEDKTDSIVPSNSVPAVYAVSWARVPIV